MTGEQFFGLEGYERVRHLLEALPAANLCAAYACWARARPPASPPPHPFRIARPAHANALTECLALVQVVRVWGLGGVQGSGFRVQGLRLSVKR